MASTDTVALLAFEARYLLRRWSFVVMALALCAFASVMVTTGYAAAGTSVNAASAVMQSLGLLSLWALFTQTVFTVHGVLRDVEHGMTELIDSRPVSRGRALVVRTAGVSAAGILAFALATLVMMAEPHLLVSDISRVAPVNVARYVVPFLTLVVPNVLIVTAFLVAVASIARSSVATYVGAVGLFGAYMLSALAVSSPIFAGGAPATPDALARAAILDPFGLSAFFEQSRYWTPAQREHDLVGLSGRYLLNRVMWLAIATVMLGFALRRLAAPGLRAAGSRRVTSLRSEDIAQTPERHAYRTVTPARAGIAAPLHAIWRLELRLLLASWPIRALLLGLTFVVTVELVQNLGAGEYGTRLLATSSELAMRATEPVLVLGVLCLVYLSGEVMWRERASRIDHLLDATPRSGSVAVWGRVLALVTVSVLLVIVAVLVAIVVQVIIGGAPVEPGVYLAHAAVTAWPLALWAIATGALHAIAGERWGGLLLGALLVALSIAGTSIGLEHPMARFPAGPDLRWSDLDGFGPALRSALAFLSYWSVAAITLGIAASGVWPRGATRRLQTRIASAWQTGGTPWRRAVATSCLASVAAAGAIWKATWADGQWTSPEATREWRAAYERRFRPLLELPQPTVQHTDVRVELHPERLRAEIAGSLRLTNRDARPIDTLWFATDRESVVHAISARAVQAIRPDPRFAMFAIPLASALRTGDTLTVSYRMTLDRSRISARGYDRMLTENGSYLNTGDLMPDIGYQGRLELTDSVERSRFRLGAATPQLVPLDDRSRRRASREWMTARLVVVTDSAQVPLATGEAGPTSIEGGRRVAAFTFDSQTPPRIAVLSGRYAVQRRVVGRTTIEVWYHPTHTENVGRILDAAATSLRVLSDRFGPYPYPTLRIVELPTGWGFGAYALPGTLLLTENRGMRLDPRRESVDLLLRRIGHEVAHQWWGGELTPANVDGAGLLVEGLAKYSEQRIVAHVHGDSALAAMLAFDHDRYLVGRARESGEERSLGATGFADDYLFYGKASIGFNALHAALGDSAMTRALRALLRTQGGPGGSATTRDLHTVLAGAATTPDQRRLLDEWFDQRFIHDLTVDTALSSPLASGHRVSIRGRAERIVRQERNEVTSLADGVTVEIRLRGEGADGARSWRGTVRTGSDGRYSLTLTLPFRPTTVELDPDFRFIDRNRSNNERSVSVGSGVP